MQKISLKAILTEHQRKHLNRCLFAPSLPFCRGFSRNGKTDSSEQSESEATGRCLAWQNGQQRAKQAGGAAVVAI